MFTFVKVTTSSDVNLRIVKFKIFKMLNKHLHDEPRIKFVKRRGGSWIHFDIQVLNGHCGEFD